MGTFYAAFDKWHWPFQITSGENDTLRIVENPGGGSEAGIEVTLTATSSLFAGTEYYAIAEADPTGPDAGSTDEMIDNQNLRARTFYDDLAKALTDESVATGNGLSYEFGSSVPRNGGIAGSGITLTHNGALDIAYDFSASVSNKIDPRFFGFDREGKSGTGTLQDGTTSSITGTSIISPFSRWGVWQAPKLADDKRLREEYDKYQSNPLQPFRTYRHRWTRSRRLRAMRYEAVAGAHLFAYDRASRASEADRAGLPQGDHNNALYDLWERTQVDRQRVIIDHDQSSPKLTLQGDVTVAQIDAEFEEMFAPQEQTDRQYRGELYDVHVPIACAQPDDYGADATPWRH